MFDNTQIYTIGYLSKNILGVPQPVLSHHNRIHSPINSESIGDSSTDSNIDESGSIFIEGLNAGSNKENICSNNTRVTVMDNPMEVDVVKDEKDNDNPKNVVKAVSKNYISNRVVVLEKRQMYYLADVHKIIGKESDISFDQSEMEIKRKIKQMNHATRFYLCVKFCRRNEIDFEPGYKQKFTHSIRKICYSTSIGVSSINKYLKFKLPKDRSIYVEMKRNRYFSPVELKPINHEIFFKKYASNYEQLKVGGIFKNRT